eukprot:m.335765 g.335765  ORF g.335765 m.335765 type:complete len:54 (+) comp17671_c0_seq1:1167-1328(+)
MERENQESKRAERSNWLFFEVRSEIVSISCPFGGFYTCDMVKVGVVTTPHVLV